VTKTACVLYHLMQFNTSVATLPCGTFNLMLRSSSKTVRSALARRARQMRVTYCSVRLASMFMFADLRPPPGALILVQMIRPIKYGV